MAQIKSRIGFELKGMNLRVLNSFLLPSAIIAGILGFTAWLIAWGLGIRPETQQERRVHAILTNGAPIEDKSWVASNPLLLGCLVFAVVFVALTAFFASRGRR